MEMVSELHWQTYSNFRQRSTVCPWVYLERGAPYQIFSEALVQSRKAVPFPGLIKGQVFDAKSKVVPESVLGCLGFNTREALKSAAL